MASLGLNHSLDPAVETGTGADDVILVDGLPDFWDGGSHLFLFTNGFNTIKLWPVS